MNVHELREYDIRRAAAFCKTTEEWGGLSNMAGGYALCVNGINIQSSESLYQACRFPDHPEVQKIILEQSSPMIAKRLGKPHIEKTRADWESSRIVIMKWCLRVKLAQNWDRFSSLLIATKDMDIIELSRKDDFWGVKHVDGDIYLGVNALGRLLMQLRHFVYSYKKDDFMLVPPPKLNNFKLFGKDIGSVSASDKTLSLPPLIGDLFESD